MDALADLSFDGWTLRRRSGELVRDGRCLRLQDKPLQVLEALLEQPGELVTREQLIARLWPRGVVDFETALNTAVRRLRHTLDDVADTPRYIETVPRRGYRFIGMLDRPVPATDVVAGDAIAGESAMVRSIGVEVTSIPPPRSPWSRRMPMIALAVLVMGGVGGFMVASRWPAPAVAPTDTRAAAPATSPEHSTIDLAAVARTIGVDSARKIVSDDDVARDQVLRAYYFLQRRAEGDVARAGQYFERALARDPDCARAWAGLAAVAWLETMTGVRPWDSGLDDVRKAAERALALDATLAEAHLRYGQYLTRTGRKAAGDAHMALATRLEPDNPLVLSFAASAAAGGNRMNDAIALQRRAVQVDPLSAISRYHLAAFYFLAGRYAEVEATMRDLLELDPTQNNKADLLCDVLVLRNGFEEAVDVARRIDDAIPREQCLALAWHGLGERERADQSLEALVRVARREDPARIAEVYAYRGEIDRAFDWLEAASASPGRGTLTRPPSPFWIVRLSPFLSTLHSDARWSAIKDAPDG